MLRVLQYIGALQIGGSQSFIMEMYRKVDKTKIQFDFVIFPNDKDGLKNEIESMGGIVYESPQYNGRNHRAYRKWWNDFLHTHKEYKILHGHVRSVAAIYVPIAKKHGVLTIVHSHSTSNGKGIKATLKDLMQFLIRYQADYLFACSEEAGKWLFGKRAVQQDNYRFIPNAIDVRRFLFNEKVREEVRNELQLADKKVIGNLGRIVLPKNQLFLLDIMEKLVKKDVDIYLLIVGEGELLNELAKRAELLGIREKVLFAGVRNDAERIYQAMDVFVFPSLWEGLPMSLVEAQASGLHCLVSDRITKDVKLTKRIHYLSLEKGADYWAESILKALRHKRSAAKKEDLLLLKNFESDTVAKKLEDFYLQCKK